MAVQPSCDEVQKAATNALDRVMNLRQPNGLRTKRLTWYGTPRMLC